jgi:hypothetical protein
VKKISEMKRLSTTIQGVKISKYESGKEETQVGFKFVATKRNDAAFPSV